MVTVASLVYLLLATTALNANFAMAVSSTSNSSSISQDSSIPKPATNTNSKRSVVLPHDKHGDRHVVHTHPDPWHQWEGLVAGLVGIHILALGFWCYLLYVSRDKNKKGSKRSGGVVSSIASTFTSREGGASGKSAEWRSPREILSAYNKQLLGKV